MKPIQEAFEKLCQSLILINAFFPAFVLIYSFIVIRYALPAIPFTHSLQLAICAVSFSIVGVWFAKNIRNPAVVWLYLGLFILYTILRNNHIILASEIKAWFVWIYPLHALINSSPTSVYLNEHGDYAAQLFSAFPISTVWGVLTAYLLMILLVLVFLAQLSRMVLHAGSVVMRKVKNRARQPQNISSSPSHEHLGWKQLFEKRQWVTFWIPMILLGGLYQANQYGFGQHTTIHPGTDPIRLSLYGLPAELNNATLNKTWIDGTPEGQQFIHQLARYNVTIYISISASSLDTAQEKEAWAEYIEYLFQRGIYVSFDGWCNIKYYYDSWRPMFKEVIKFRTDPLYRDRLHGLVGISGDFETNAPTGMDAALFQEVHANVTAELEWMKTQLTAANLTREDFKFGSISGVELDVIDADEDMGIFFESIS